MNVDIEDDNESYEDYSLKLAKLTPGCTVGIRSGTGVRKLIYRLATVTKVTKAQIVTTEGRFHKDNGREVGNIGYVVPMTPKQVEAWKQAKANEEAERKRREAEYDPREHDDHVQAALRALRNKARTLCEKLQGDLIYGIPVKPKPHWNQEFLDLVREIEESEHALKSFGVSTTLKSHADLSSLAAR